MKIPFLKPDIRASDIKNVAEAIRSGWLTRGPRTIAFEAEMAHYLGVASASMVASGTAALHSALAAAGIKEGDEVITTPISAVQTANAILYTGATPVFVDIAPSTGLIDLERIEEKITAKTKAIIPVHYYGQMVDMIRLAKIAKKHGIVIIEDAAHALEAVRDGNRPGALSFAAAFSFHAAKNMTAGQGGALVSNDTTVTEFTNAFCDSGIRRIDGARRSVMLGYKYPITSFQVALLEGQLTRLAANHKKRLAVFARYRAGLSKVTGITLIEDVPGSVHACHLFNVLVDPACRDAIRKDLSAAGIDTAVFHEVIHLEPYFKDRFGYKAGDFPHAERFAASLIGLPTYPGLTAREQSYIIKHLTEQLV